MPSAFSTPFTREGEDRDAVTSSEVQKRKQALMRSIIHHSHRLHEEGIMCHFIPARTARRLMLIATVINITGIACLSGGAQARVSVASRSSMMEVASLLDSIGFTLMLPGVFFATIVFLCGSALAWNDETTRVAWYAFTLVINLIIAWKIGAGLDGAARA